MRSAFPALLLLLLLLVPLGARAEEFSFRQPLMGTLFQIRLHAESEAVAAKAARAAFERVAELERIFSDYAADSEIMRLIGQPVGTATKVSPELFDAVERSRAITRKTGGAFDITMGPHVRNWRMARRTGKLPTPEEIAAASAAVGIDRLRADPKQQTLTMTVPGMRLDFGGMAKGLAADAALAVLKAHGCERSIVAAGGDLAIGAPPPGADGWKVEILGADGRRRLRALCHVGVSTSGDREQFLEIGGERYSHIVDPRTGLGVRHSDSVTVIAPCASLSDPLATALSVLDAKAAKAAAAELEGVSVIRAEGKRPKAD